MLDHSNFCLWKYDDLNIHETLFQRTTAGGGCPQDTSSAAQEPNHSSGATRTARKSDGEDVVKLIDRISIGERDAVAITPT